MRFGTLYLAAADICKGQTVVICDESLAMPYWGESHHCWAKDRGSHFTVGVAMETVSRGDVVSVDLGMALSKGAASKPLAGAEAELYRMIYAVEKGQAPNGGA